MKNIEMLQQKLKTRRGIGDAPTNCLRPVSKYRWRRCPQNVGGAAGVHLYLRSGCHLSKWVLCLGFSQMPFTCIRKCGKGIYKIKKINAFLNFSSFVI
jgi:hypothetical protein